MICFSSVGHSLCIRSHTALLSCSQWEHHAPPQPSSEREREHTATLLPLLPSCCLEPCTHWVAEGFPHHGSAAQSTQPLQASVPSSLLLGSTSTHHTITASPLDCIRRIDRQPSSSGDTRPQCHCHSGLDSTIATSGSHHRQPHKHQHHQQWWLCCVLLWWPQV